MMVAVRGRVNAAGQLVAADAPLLALQEAAGGILGGPMLVPAPARLAAIAQRLQAPVERSVVMANDEQEIRAHGRFLPDSEGVRIELVDWEAVPAPDMASDDVLPPTPRRIIPPGAIRWAVDIRLRLVMVDADPLWQLADARGPGGWLGHSMAELFHLTPDRGGQFPLLNALAKQEKFERQAARLAAGAVEGTILTLRGQPLMDGEIFTGFHGEAAPVGFGRLPAEISRDHDDGGAAEILGMIDTRSFALRIDGALRRPLGRIVANAETIAGQLDGPIRGDYARYASDIALAGRHLLDLIDDLADLQAVERQNFTVASEHVDLADVARRASGLLAMKAKERGIRIDAPRSDEAAPAVGEFRRVLQILINLIGNAIRYGPEDAMVWVRVDTEDGMARVTVADQGPGISAEDQVRLFEKFERLGRTDSGGSGLGLYISRRLAQAMGGDISIDSAPGQGARFTLSLPLDMPVA